VPKGAMKVDEMRYVKYRESRVGVNDRDRVVT